MPHLFTPLRLRGIELPHRILVSPMCQYSSVDGFANEWHLVHLGSRAVGGAAIVFTEATAVTPEGRISPQDLGIWKDEHIEPLARITHFLHQQGAVPGMQLAHAGRKGSTYRPWSEKQGEVAIADGGWQVVGPSPLRFDHNYPEPRELTAAEVSAIPRAFAFAAKRALAAGFRCIELHSAHGYLLHQFFSPLSNHRTDEYGGSFDNRTRLAREVVEAVREVWPDHLPLFVRISATDWAEGGWTVEESVELARKLGAMGVDLIDVSSGGLTPAQKIVTGPGYQTGFSERIMRESGVKTGAVGMITDPVQADHIIRTGQAEVVLLAREMLRDPYFPLRAAHELGHSISWPAQYTRAASSSTPARGEVDGAKYARLCKPDDRP